MNQILGFAVFGGWLAVTAAAIGAGAPGDAGWTAFVVSASFPASTPVLGEPFVVEGIVGVVLGAAVGAVLRLCGVRVAGPADGRIGRVVSAGVVGAAAAVGAMAAVAFSGAMDYPGTVLLLLAYAVTGLVAYGLSLVCVRTVLVVSGDRHVRETVRALAWIVPVGAAVAVAAGVFTAWLADFSTVESTWVSTCGIVLLVVGATFAAGRSVALRRVSSNE